jgi:hypothetical protein
MSGFFSRQGGPRVRTPDARGLAAYAGAVVVVLVLALGLVDLLAAGTPVAASRRGDVGLVSTAFFSLAALAAVAAAAGALAVAGGGRRSPARPTRALVVLAVALTFFLASWVGARVAVAVTPGPVTAAGFVTAFNPTATRFALTVNGSSETDVPATGAARDWRPALASPVVRSPTGQPADGAFAWENELTVAPESAGGAHSRFEVAIPRWLQTVNDLQLYLLYLKTGLPAYVLLFQGTVLSEDLVLAPRQAGSPRLHQPTTKEILAPPGVNKQSEQEASMAGAVTIFNPTATAFTITVNGRTQFDIPATTATAKWLPATGKNPIPRSASGQPSDGNFGWDSIVTIAPESGGGAVATADVKIPHTLQTVNDLQLYLFYAEDPTDAVWVLMFQGEIAGSGGMH